MNKMKTVTRPRFFKKLILTSLLNLFVFSITHAITITITVETSKTISASRNLEIDNLNLTLAEVVDQHNKQLYAKQISNNHTLFYNNQVLDRDKTLAHYNIPDGGVITAALREEQQHKTSIIQKEKKKLPLQTPPPLKPFKPIHKSFAVTVIETGTNKQKNIQVEGQQAIAQLKETIVRTFYPEEEQQTGGDTKKRAASINIKVKLADGTTLKDLANTQDEATLAQCGISPHTEIFFETPASHTSHFYTLAGVGGVMVILYMSKRMLEKFRSTREKKEHDEK